MLPIFLITTHTNSDLGTNDSSNYYKKSISRTKNTLDRGRSSFNSGLHTLQIASQGSHIGSTEKFFKNPAYPISSKLGKFWPTSLLYRNNI